MPYAAALYRCACVAGDEIGASSSSAARDVSCCRILPKINDVPGLTVPGREEATDSLSHHAASVWRDHGSGGNVGFNHSRHKPDPENPSDSDGLPEQKLLPSLCAASWANGDSVAVADIHAADSSSQEKLPPSHCGSNSTKDGCESLADKCAADIHEKLLPSLCDSNLTKDDSDSVAADSQSQEKLLPRCNANPTSGDNLADICDTDSKLQRKLLPSLSAVV